jgi:two-component system chemotaxis sensor kinase CheA
METSPYLPMFLAEAREHLQALNLALVGLEREPESRSTLEEIFRIAHSFKGMSATMGFSRLASVAHQMEEVLELVRLRRGPLDPRLVDTLLACLDGLEGAVDALEEGRGEEIEDERLIAALAALVRRQDGAEEEAAGAPPSVPAAGALEVRVLLAEDAPMPGVRAFQVLEELAEHGTLLSSRPDRRGIESFRGREVTARLLSEDAPEEIERSLLALSEVVSARVVASGSEAGEGEAPSGGEPTSFLSATRRPGRSVRIDSERLDQLMHLMGEVVVQRTRLEALVAASGQPELQRALQDLTRSSQALQAMIMQVRMIPVEAVFLRFPRVVRDLASSLGKEVELVLAGQETELDRTMVEALADPLVHLVRNALDHGLETPAERLAAGKPPRGRLELAARQAGGSVVITVADDGRGIDRERVAAKALARGLVADPAEVDTARACELVFEPGLSTSEEASDLSGRGVGMDAVRASVRALGGEVSLRSEAGRGTTAEIRLPLTLAIAAVLLVEAAGEPFAVPLERVERTVRLSREARRSVAGYPHLVLPDGVVPLVDAASVLGRRARGGEPAYAVLVQSGERRLALAVERLVGQRELVTRPLPGGVCQGAAVSAGAVLADGGIALVVDCDALADHARSASSLACAA